MRLALGAIIGLVLVAAVGCGGKKADTVVKAEARAPISASVAALSPQAREVPWAGQTLRASAPFELAAKEGLTAPISAGEARVEARQVALTELARQLSRLPASEPPPGEAVESNVGDFATRQPQFAVKVEEQLLAAEEVVRLVPEEGRGQVELALPLSALAAELLKSGGGFRKGDKLSEAIGPRGIAARKANTEAEDKLLRAVLATRIDDKRTVQDWVREEPVNRRMLLETLSKKKTVVGEARPVSAGSTDEEFVVEFEVDLKQLIDAARGQEKARIRAQEAAKQ
ncbi:hypothetical protein GC173_13115 [bacterium]|nr:hypothetical protein [bacterium]